MLITADNQVPITALKYISHLTNMSGNSKEVFISYAWGGESEQFVNQLDQAFQRKDVTVIRDKRELGYKGLIKEFMERIGRGKCVIAVVSDKYLKSPNCMFELLEVSKNGQFYDRIFPITLSDAKIYSPVDRIDYIIHWDNEIQKLDAKLKMVSSNANLITLQQAITQYAEFRAMIDKLTYTLQNMNALTPDIHSQSDFEALLEAIRSKLTESVVEQDKLVKQAVDAKDLRKRLAFLEFRRQVKEFLLDGEISTYGQSRLKQLRQDLGLSEIEAKQIVEEESNSLR